MERTVVRDSALVRLCDRNKTLLRTARHFFERRQLEAGLATLIEAAKGHEARGVPPGSPAYFILYKQSDRIVAEYCSRWQMTPEQVDAEIPALGKLRHLATVPQQTRVAHSLLLVVAATVMAFLAGIAAGMVRLGYQFIGGGR